MKNSGFVMVMALLFIAMISTTLLYWLEALWLYRQSTHMLERKYKNFYALEKAAFSLITKKAQKNDRCIVSSRDPTAVLQQINNLKPCKKIIGKYQFTYIIEDLGDYPCHLLNSNSSHHWRLSIFEKAQDNIALQLRYAEQSLISLPCEDNKFMQLHGKIMSYRYTQRQ